MELIYYKFKFYFDSQWFDMYNVHTYVCSTVRTPDRTVQGNAKVRAACKFCLQLTRCGKYDNQSPQ